MSKNYSFDLIADTSGAISGFENTTSINDSGLVAAIGQFDSIEDLLVGDGETPVVNLSNQYSGRFSSGIEINNDNKIVARDSAGFSAIRLWDVNAPGSFSKNIATGGFGNSFLDFENTLPFPRLSNNSESDRVAFLADLKGGSIETALVTFAGEGFNGRNYNEIILSNSLAKPAIADDGTVVIKDLGERIVVYDYQLNLTDVVASSFKGFSSVGESPGISDEGGAIVFYGNLTNPGGDSTTVGLDSGEGIFVSIETDAGRKIERIAGIAGNGILDPGETHEDTNENGEVDLGEDQGLIGSFSTDERDRLGINFKEETSSGNIVFLSKDESGRESIINSNFKISTDEETTLTTVSPQLLAKAGQEASEVLSDLTGNIQDLHIYDPINKSGQIAFWAKTTTSEEAVIRANPIRKPVFILPGIGGSLPESGDFGGWLLDRGVDPDTLEIDYLANIYDDLIQTLENAGYQQGVDLFVANYDWRLNPGPIDGNIDGRIERSVEELTDDTYEYAVDQLAFWLEESITGWKSQFTGLPEAEIPDLDSVDIIAHSTGGLVARSYIQSDAYGGAFTDDSGQQVNLPKVDNFISIGVPNRGASQAWRSTQNDFYSGDGLIPENSGRFLIHKILRSAYQKVTRENNPETIALSGNNNSNFAINDPDIIPTEFIEQYVPTLRSLLATYPFLDSLPNNGNLQRIEEIDPSQRNNLALDLNNGYDSVAQGTTTDPNLFVDDVELATIIYGENEDTNDAVEERDEPNRGLFDIPERTVHPIENRSRQVPDGIWYQDLEGIAANNPNLPNDIRGLQGDGTVPLQSSAGQFLDDTKTNLIREPFRRRGAEVAGGNTDESVDHGGLVYNTDVQQLILDTLGVNLDEDSISTDLAGLAPIDAGRALWGIIFDPVEGFLIDGQGRRLGYSEATGAVTEIPNTFWLGEADGIGFVQDTLDGPLRLELTGLGEEYFISAELETEDGPAGIESEGFLAAGEQLTLNVPVNNAPILDLNGNGDGIDATAFLLRDGGTVPITNSNLVIGDVESPNMAGATVTIQNPLDSNLELLNATAAGNITVDYDADTSTLTLDGTDTIANYQQVLSSVTYTNNAANPDTTPREIIFVVNDGADFNNLSPAATTVVSVPDGSNGQNIFNIVRGSGTTTISNFGGVGEGTNPSANTLSELDLLKFNGAGLTAKNLLLTPSGSDLILSFAGINDTKVVLSDFTLEDFDNLPDGIGNILFNTQTEIQDSIDVFDSLEAQGEVFGANKVTFLNNSNNSVDGLNNSDDVINGLANNNTFDGRSGKDLLRGRAGNDTLTGGLDDDTIDGGTGNDTLTETADRNFTLTDTTLVGVGNDTLTQIEAAILTGGASNNTIKALEVTAINVTLDGAGGNDNLVGGALSDLLIGSSGNDRLAAKAGDDTLDGGTGSDTLYGDNGKDSLNGGADNDILYGQNGNDTITGGLGDDTINGGDGTDSLAESGDVNFTLTDTTLTGNGNDIITQIEAAILTGGSGNNTIKALEVTAMNVTLDGQGGNDNLVGGALDDSLIGSEGNDRLAAKAGDDRLDGGNGDDTLYGDTGNDLLNGSGDDDILYGQNGDDRLVGKTGDDRLFGGAGDDTFYGDAGDDNIDGGGDNDLLYGQDGNDTMIGGSGNDTINGGNNDDRLVGGAGNDTMIGGNGSDVFVLQSIVGTDMINDFSDGEDLFGLEGSLSYEDLSFSTDTAGTGTLIMDTTNDNQVLAMVSNLDPSLITSDDFVTI